MIAPRERSPAARRAFALPVVLIVMLVMTTLAAIMLQRQGAQLLLTQRQLYSYQEHHARYGIEEVLGSWLRTIPRNVTLLNALGPEGHALDLDLRDGTIAEVYVRDAQGAVLEAFDALDAEDVQWATELARVYDELCRAGRTRPATRRVGPAALSVMTAPPEALRAVFQVLFPEADANQAVATIVSRRATTTEGAEVIREAQTALGLTSVERQRLARALAATPTLHFVEVRLRAARGGGGELARFGGHVPIERGRAVGEEMWSARSAFLDWGPVSGPVVE